MSRPYLRKMYAVPGEVPLTQGKIALVDPEDWPYVMPYSWYAQRVNDRWYAATVIRDYSLKQRKTVQLHRFIMQPAPDLRVTFLNGNTLDCRRENLRLVTPSPKSAATQARCGRPGYRGVAPHGRRWVAKCGIDGKTVYLGRFATEEEAARAYDAAVRTAYGPSARTNFDEYGQPLVTPSPLGDHAHHRRGAWGRRPGSLPPRVCQTLDLLCEGLATQEIAQAMGISPATVKEALKHAYKSLGVHKRREAVIAWQERHQRSEHGAGTGADPAADTTQPWADHGTRGCVP